ncbi:DUF2384 domain-containing protein [Spongiibacter sp. KMU-158]|uniref:DUF2384 domain-containing protein n=1 Tax=Spongiibacter pelagi TaxID=2760804 RepID=A0A927GX22_9GAMM|nr:MbcA/ParS/Xre antitoxin family protein [Spongiibacter pelagi]MBD2859547.1 DUF2384 domain-containing protein [Spongiibacter pelagi]
MSTVANTQLERTAVAAKALINAKEALGLSGEIIGQIIGADASTVSRIARRGDMADNKSLEAAVLLIRIYRSLYALRGGNVDAMKHWLNTPNLDFNEEAPLNVMKRWVGLVDVVQYLDAMRGHG